MTAQPGLTAQGGPYDGQFFPLLENETTIGRQADCSIVINWDLKASRHHARIYQQSGLYWLEDTGSSNGTFITPQGGDERQLKPNESVLLLDGALIRLGKQIKFLVTGSSASQDEAMQQLAARLQQMLSSMYAGIAHVQPEDREAQLEWLRGFEARLRGAESQEEMLLIASEVTNTLFGTVHMEPQADKNLPPLSEDVPDPNAAQLIESIIGVFHSNIWKRFPKENDKNDRSD